MAGPYDLTGQNIENTYQRIIQTPDGTNFYDGTGSAVTIGAGGVTKIIAGSGISVSPSTGLGDVTVTNLGAAYNTMTGSYGSFYDTTTQTNVANTPRSMSLNTTDISNGVLISGSTNPYNTYIKITNAGIYNIQFSAQIDKTDSGTDDLWIWVRRNGLDIPDTATAITLQGNNTQYVAAWNWFVTAAANDYFQLIWYSPDADMRLHAEPASGAIPGIPSLIVTAQRIDTFLSNTGSFSGSFNGIHTGSFTGSFTGSLFGTSSWAQSASVAISSITSSYPIATTGSTIYTTNPPARTSSPITATSNNIFLGENTGNSGTVVNSNYIGQNAGFGANIGSNSNFIGTSAGLGSFSSNNSNFIGVSAGQNSYTSSWSNFIGRGAGQNSACSYSHFLGYLVGSGLTGSNNIIIGNSITLPNNTQDSINLGGIIFATGSYRNLGLGPAFSGSQQGIGRVGINIVSPNYTLDVSGSGNYSNGLTVTGSFTVITGSTIEFQVLNTGVNIGNVITDIHNVTGSLRVNGSITGSLLGTSSWAQSSSVAISASYVLSSSYALSSSFVTTASYVRLAESASYVPTVQTSTNATFYPVFVDSNNSPANYEQLYTDGGAQNFTYNPNTGVLTAKSFSNGASSNPITASWAINALTASYTPNALITASVSSNVLTFTKGNGTTFNLTVNTGSGGGGGSTSPGGDDTNIQFNSGSTFSGSNNLTYQYDNAAPSASRLEHQYNNDFASTAANKDFAYSYSPINTSGNNSQKTGISHYQTSQASGTGGTVIYRWNATPGGQGTDLEMYGFKCDYSLLLRDEDISIGNFVASRTGTLQGAWSWNAGTPVLSDNFVDGDVVYNELGTIKFTLSYNDPYIELLMDTSNVTVGTTYFNGLFTNFGKYR